jgi:hypothetical protein
MTLITLPEILMPLLYNIFIRNVDPAFKGKLIYFYTSLGLHK